MCLERESNSQSTERAQQPADQEIDAADQVWGAYNAMTERDAEAMKRASALLRWAGSVNMTRGFAADGCTNNLGSQLYSEPRLFTPSHTSSAPHTLLSTRWEPHTPHAVQPAIAASRFVHRDGHVLYLLVNTQPAWAWGVQLRLPAAPNATVYDLYHGAALTPAAHGGGVQLSFDVEPSAFGAALPARLELAIS